MSLEREGYDPDAFERIAMLEPRSWWFRSRNRLISQAVRRHFGAAGDVLEIGCGTGFSLQALKNALPGAQLTGTELFGEGLQVARRRWPELTLTQADARALPFGCEFDLVGAFDVLEHIDDDRRALREAFRVLRPGGGLIVTVPQHRWLWSAADEYACHERRYSRAELIERIEGAGFVSERVTSFVSLLLPLMATSRARARRRGGHYDPWREFQISRVADRTFELIADLERRAIASGASFSAGGSLLALARKPSSMEDWSADAAVTRAPAV